MSQGEGGEQGDPLMPALFALALAPAPRSFQEELHPGEHVRGPFSRTSMLPLPLPAQLPCCRASNTICSRHCTFGPMLAKRMCGILLVFARPISHPLPKGHHLGW